MRLYPLEGWARALDEDLQPKAKPKAAGRSGPEPPTQDTRHVLNILNRPEASTCHWNEQRGQVVQRGPTERSSNCQAGKPPPCATLAASAPPKWPAPLDPGLTGDLTAVQSPAETARSDCCSPAGRPDVQLRHGKSLSRTLNSKGTEEKLRIRRVKSKSLPRIDIADRHGSG